jgi:hypothetical protein
LPTNDAAIKLKKGKDWKLYLMAMMYGALRFRLAPKKVFVLTMGIIVAKQIRSKTMVFEKSFLCKQQTSKEKTAALRKNQPKP